MSSDFRANVAFVIDEKFGRNCRDKTVADALGVDRSTVNRLRNSDRLPTRSRLEALSRYFGLAVETWELSGEDFIANARDQITGTGARKQFQHREVSMAAIFAYRHQWDACLQTHRGQYIAYWKASDSTNSYIASLLEILRLGAGGLEFELLNPYIRDDVETDEHRIWRYHGVCYPVADYLYFFGEQSTNTYELFSMIMTASPVQPPDILRGCMTGIHVKDGKKQIAINIAVVLLSIRKPVTDWRGELGGRLGKLPAGKIPERVRRLIDPFPGVIPLGV